MHGWDNEHMQAWRADPQKDPKLKAKDPTKELLFPEDEDEAGKMIARWPDGHTWAVPNVTAKYWKTRLEALNSKAGLKRRSSKFSEKHEITKNLIEVKPRMDRFPLVSIYIQGQQVLQVRQDGFPGGDVDEQQKNAMAFMKKIAQELLADKVEVAALQACRDERLRRVDGYYERLKEITRRNAVKRRPSANAEQTTKKKVTTQETTGNKTKTVGQEKPKKQKKPKTIAIDPTAVEKTPVRNRISVKTSPVGKADDDPYQIVPGVQAEDAEDARAEAPQAEDAEEARAEDAEEVRAKDTEERTPRRKVSRSPSSCSDSPMPLPALSVHEPRWGLGALDV